MWKWLAIAALIYGLVAGAFIASPRSTALMRLSDLADLGGSVLVGHDARHIEDASAVIFTSAVPKDHPELAAARAAGIPVMKRAEALGAWVNAEKLRYVTQKRFHQSHHAPPFRA